MRTITLLQSNISKGLVIVLLLALFLTFPIPVFGAEQPVSQSFRITPDIVDTTIIPGQTKTIQITIDNLMIVPLGMHVETQNFTEENDSSVEEISQPKNDLLKWTHISENEFIIDAKKSKRLTITIMPPKDAKNSGYYEMLFFTPFFSKPLDPTKPVVLSRVGALVLGQIGTINYNDLASKVKITNVDFGGRFLHDTSSSPKLTVENKYFTHFDAKPFITITPLFGKAITEQISDRHILPGTSKTFTTTIVLPANHLFYSTYVAVSVGNGEQLTANSYFFILPFANMLLPFILLIIALILWLIRKRIKKALSIILFNK